MRKSNYIRVKSETTTRLFEFFSDWKHKVGAEIFFVTETQQIAWHVRIKLVLNFIRFATKR